ncbi:hypothetical protein Agub_g5462 [Astrephomene gubernaculifera]|uniref:Phosphotyrosine protein phosphatase I domain-containing protein n=1 Tax=Astrephomene gubernaculifera TaxID=47775 RepID=A0AAD3DLX5_9CHLO|nr:hypothetical protein Agub_g5462 [Astrephomene gubernaculifera]
MQTCTTRTRAGPRTGTCSRLLVAPRCSLNPYTTSLRARRAATSPGTSVPGVSPELFLGGAKGNTGMSTRAVPNSAAANGDDKRAKIGVLFVCLGNICRSPTAEAVFRSVVERAGLQAAFDIDSCGTGGGNPDWFMEGGWSYHEGDPADSRMSMAARKRGVRLTSRSRPLQPPDFNRFQYIVGMDGANLKAIRTAADYWLVRPMGQGKVPPDYATRISLMTSYCRKSKGETEVPDPYYGGLSGFERVLDLLEDACEGLLDTIRREHGL